MRHRNPSVWIKWALWLLIVLCTGCSANRPPGEDVGEARSDIWTNGSFEMGAAGTAPQGWNVNTFLNNNGVATTTPTTIAELQLAAGGVGLTTEIAAVNQAQPDLGAAASLRICRYGNQCAQVNFHSSTTFGHGKNVNSLNQTMTVAAGDVDPSDGQVHVRFAIAPVLQNPGHTAVQQPYYFVQVTNVTQGTVLYTDFNLSAQAGVPWKTINGGMANEIDYVDWALVDVSPGGTGINMGDKVELNVIASGCQPGGHYGEVYVDGVGALIPGLFVWGTGPAQANAGSNITYTLNYNNNSGMTETGVVIDFTTPPGTTFQSFTPPAGATCTTPPVGMPGTIVCTFSGPMPAGTVGNFTITVNVDPGTTGTVVAGTYDIHSNQETPLTGNKIVTQIGCTADSQCTGGNWCDESKNACTPPYANGTPIPSDPPHTNPTLGGVCTAGAGALVCASGVCDTNDNECGYANGDGPCNAGNADVVCRSQVCDPDGKCGYANGDGPCMPATGPTVCRSGMCSVSDTCEPSGGCNVDADCTMGNWCNETMHMCTPQLPNGTAVPNDPAHTSPTVNGTCTMASGALVCVSGVCDTSDNKCGYANGDGPCTGSDGDTVCRSTICATSGSNNGKCVACVMDSQCPGASPTCNTSSNTCVQCTSSAQCMGMTPVCDMTTSTCVPCKGDLGSGAMDACDQPNSPFCFLQGPNQGECGKCMTNTDCAGHTGNICNTTTGLCISGCLKDSDCQMGQWCNETAMMCAPKVANGMPLPSDPAHTTPPLNGTCTAAAAMLTCQSGVCDTKDNECGLADGDGQCTNNEQCRDTSATCDMTTMKCTPAGCHSDSDCASTQYCGSAGMCTPKQPDGSPCTASDQCINADCDQHVCTSIIGSGNGLICAARPAGGRGEGAAGLLGMALALAGLSRRRRR